MKIPVLLTALALAAFAALIEPNSAQTDHKLQSVSLRKMADSLHAVIASEDQAYLQLQPSGPGQDSLPPHAELLRQANARIQQKGAEFSFSLRSLWPVQPRHGPQTQVEERGLQHVASHPEEPVFVEEMLGGRSYFTAIYATRAESATCVDCHNRLPGNPRTNYVTGDVMGAIVIRIPLEF